MDFEQFSDPEVRDFLLENLSKEPGLLVLKNLSVSGIPAKDLAVQLNGLQKSQKKLPNWFNTAGIVFPAGISVEQCSSEITASHKASLISGETMVDLTGGFGVDSFYFSQKVTKLDYVETQNPLLEIAQYNHKLLKATNIAYSNTAAIDFLKTKPNHHYDWIYLDPARRDDAKNRVFFLEDCEPAVLEIIDLLFQKGNRILLKTSPLLDIHKAIIDLGNVSEVLVLAVENECKELLFVLEKNPKPTICKTVNFTKSGHQNFEFLIENESKAWAGFSEPQKYLYEPNAAILKSGAFKSVGGKFDLKKLHPSSHLYTSMDLKKEFPGRTFKIENVLPMDKKEILKHLPDKKANVTVRNFPQTVEEIRKKTGIKEGGDIYIFATTGLNEVMMVLVCKKC